MTDFDLVDEMHWEDLIEFETLKAAGLESQDYDTRGGVLKAYFEGEA